MLYYKCCYVLMVSIQSVSLLHVKYIVLYVYIGLAICNLLRFVWKFIEQLKFSFRSGLCIQ